MHLLLAYVVFTFLLVALAFGVVTILCIARLILNEISTAPSAARPSKQRSSLFPDERNLVVYGGNFVSAGDSDKLTIRQDSCKTPEGIVEGVRVLTPEDLPPNDEIHRGPGYRLYSARASGTVVMVKHYEGLRSKERCLEAAKFSQRVMHPNVLHLFGVSSRNSQLPFLAFHGDYEGTVESRIGLALKENLEKGLFLGLQTVAGVSSGLSYLSILNYPFASVGLEHFSLLLSRTGKIVICFDPEVLGDISEGYQRRPGNVNVELDIFNRLCQKTFDTASRDHNESRHIQRTHTDEFDVDPDDRFEELDPDTGQDLGGGADSSLRSTSDGTDLTTSNQQPPATFPTPRTPSSRGPSEKSHRRELAWKSEGHENASLELIAREFKDFLDISPSVSSAFNRRRGRYMTRTAHRCPGYQPDKVLLTADIKRSAIVSYLTPTPHEICLVCKEIVRDAEIFGCICGGDDDESTPTIQCLSCSIWYHRPCVGFIDSVGQSRSFVCHNCKAELASPASDKSGSDLGVPAVEKVKTLPGMNKLFRSFIKGLKRTWKPTSSVQLSPTDIIIAVIGAPGSGKSTFISKSTGDISWIGSDGSLDVNTTSSEMIKFFSHSLNSSIVFIDTPGFPGDAVDDGCVMDDISNLLRDISKKRLTLSGLLYFHKISDNRLPLGPRQALEYFKATSKGPGLNESNVILVTALWDTVKMPDAEAREAKLVEDYQWGGRTARFSRELPDEDIFQIIKPLVAGKSQPASLIPYCIETT